jgi:hypothetical protein
MTHVIDTIRDAGGGGDTGVAPSPARRRGPWLGCLGLVLALLLVVGGAVAALAVLISGFHWNGGPISLDTGMTCRTSPDGLSRAAIAGDVAAVRTFLGRHPDLNAKDLDGDTPMSCAVRGGSAPVVRMLLAAGAAPDLAGSGNFPCLSFVELSGATRAAADCRLPIAQAVDAKRADLVALLVAHGADPNAALLEASVTDDVRLGRIAIEHGADPNGGGGTTPLVYNVAFSNDAFVTMLLDHGADPNLGGPADAGQVLHYLGQVVPGSAPGDRALRQLVCGVEGTAPNLAPVVVAAAVGDTSSMRALLAHHGDPNAAAVFDHPLSAAMVAQVAHEQAAASVLRAAGATAPGPTASTSTVPRFGC